MDTDTRDGRSTISRPQNEFRGYSIQEPAWIQIKEDERRTISSHNVQDIPKSSHSFPVRIQIEEDERRTISSHNVHNIPKSSHSFPVSSDKKVDSIFSRNVKLILCILSVVALLALLILAWRRLMIWIEAYKIKRHIDFNVDPCDDFYKFACGQFIKTYESLIGSSYIDQFMASYATIVAEKRGLLEQPIKEDELQIMKKTKLFYKACTDIESINQRGAEPMKELLINELGGWPLTYAEWNESTFDLAATLAKIHLLLLYPLLRWSVSYDIKDNRKKSIEINQPKPLMPDRNVYLAARNSTQLMAYEELIKDIATILRFADDTTAADDIKALVDFEIKLTEISHPLEDQRERVKIYNPMTLKDVQGNYSQILNWTRFAETLMSLPEVNIGITDQDIILNEAPLYFEKLADVINNTTNRIIANYIVWAVVYNLGMYNMAGTTFKEAFDKYEKAIDRVISVSVQLQCVLTTTDVFPLPVGRLFVQSHFDKQAKVIALDMVEELKKAFSELLEESDWLDEQTKKYAEEKSQLISAKIGYPDYLYNESYVDDVYSGFKVGTKYFENMINFCRYHLVENLRSLKEPVNKDIWIAQATATNAYYVPSINEIIFPAGILQSPFFEKARLKSMNFGAIGTIIGHEITHGFDDQGRHFGKDGNLFDWWSNEAEENFKAKAQCMIDQYGNFTLEPSKIKVNGVRTLGENIADNGGLKQAFRAYRNWVKAQGQEEVTLPDLNFTNNQIFFVSFAQVWCKVKAEGIAKLNINIDTHSLNQFRVKGTVQNSKDFAEAFHCSVDSKMNPSKKCEVW